MPPEESAYTSEWIRIGEKDLIRVERLLEMDDPAAAGFYLQQAVEKFLKAFLISTGWRLQRIHDLEALLNAALRHDPALEIFREPCQKITSYYTIERYPLLSAAGPTTDDVCGSLDKVRSLLDQIRVRILKSR
jgi:HEPN domain-containing protein